MIVGNGLIAKTFANSPINWDDCIIFASGVSNSREEKESAYKREIDLINSFLGTEKHFIYFSTVSIFDKELSETAYVKHKKQVEEFILQSFERALIIRLPIVVSSENNDRQLLGYIKTTIEAGETLAIYKNAARYFIDAQQIPNAISCCLKFINGKNYSKWAINIGIPKQVKLTDIAQIIKDELYYTNIQTVDKGNSYEVDFKEFEEVAKLYCEDLLNESAEELLRSKILMFKKK
jgi:nucleoside-diphosphate-sugar epimerase